MKECSYLCQPNIIHYSHKKKTNISLKSDQWHTHFLWRPGILITIWLQYSFCPLLDSTVRGCSNIRPTAPAPPLKITTLIHNIPAKAKRTLMVQEGWGYQISRQSAHEGGKVVSPKDRPPWLPRKYSWYSFLLEAKLTSGPYCGRKDYVNEKFQWHHR